MFAATSLPQQLWPLGPALTLLNSARCTCHTTARRKTPPERNRDSQPSKQATATVSEGQYRDYCDPLLNSRVNSYVSTTSFFENKHGFSQSSPPEREMRAQELLKYLTPIVHNSGILRHPLFTGLLMPRRNFKTRRADTMSGIGGGSTAVDKSQSVKQFLKEPLAGFEYKLDKKSDAAKDARHSGTIGKILADAENSPELADKVKIAFAEGYLAHDKRESPEPAKPSLLARITRGLVYIACFWLIIQLFQVMSSMGGGMRGLGIMTREHFEVNPEEITVSFADVCGVDEAKDELQDMVDFLKEPEKYTNLGAKLPKGVLLVGPPGIGKTLLARAVAGEAGVPFFHASGSEFDEIFVGTGAKRVRQLFSAAKARAPCVVFIDEIDTVGAKRTSSQIHPYANQTINMLLSEMDGFHQNEGVIVLGATNKRENLDKALLRPGRFDVEVRVFPPDLKGRIDIINLYLKRVKRSPEIDVDKLGRGTTGFSGADLENLVNQAALKAAMDNCEVVTMDHLEFARDKILMGPAKKTKIPDEETNLITAYHEAGHTLVAFFTKDATPLHKVTIIPRGMSLGHTSFVPEKEIYNKSKSQLLADMDVAMGGRVAEELMYGSDKITTGAGGDFQQATAIATAMVKNYGMSEKVGVRVFNGDPVDSGLSMVKVNEVGPSTTELLDNEIKRLLQESYDRAKAILKNHSVEHKALAQALMRHETLDAQEIKAVIEGKITVESV